MAPPREASGKLAGRLLSVRRAKVLNLDAQEAVFEYRCPKVTLDHQSREQ